MNTFVLNLMQSSWEYIIHCWWNNGRHNNSTKKKKKEKRVEGERIEATLEDLKETNIMIRTSRSFWGKCVQFDEIPSNFWRMNLNACAPTSQNKNKPMYVEPKRSKTQHVLS